MVDEIVMSIDQDLSCCLTLNAIEADIFAKGGDRFANEIPEAKICQEKGIKIVDSLGKKIRNSSDFTQLKPR
jgi:hypothetical protein